MARITIVAQTVGASVLGAAILALALELSIRVFCPEIPEIGTSRTLVVDTLYGMTDGLRPDATGVSDGAPVCVNSMGYWKYSAVSDSGAPGWLILGDSVTMGVGVDPDSTFIGRLAQAFRSYTVCNASWLGYSSADYLNVLRGRLALPVQSRTVPIKRVTVFWTLNDVYSNQPFGRQPGTLVRIYGGPVMTFVARHVRTYQWIKGLLFDRPLEYYQFDRQFYNLEGDHFRSCVSDLQAIASICRRSGITLDLVILPYEYQLRTGVEDFLPQTMILQMTDRLGIPCWDASGALRTSGVEPRKLFRFGDGIHLSREGHRVLFTSLRKLYSSLAGPSQ